MGSQGHVRESMDVATTGNPVSTQQQRKAGRKSAAKLRRNSRRLIEYNTKQAISVIPEQHILIVILYSQH
jgi:hypothetical protein